MDAPGVEVLLGIDREYREKARAGLLRLIAPRRLNPDGKAWLPKVMVGTGLATSNGEARRAVQQGGVRLDGVALDDPEAEFEPETLRGKVLQVGRRRFVRLT